MSALHYYVYYKIDPPRVDELRAVVNALFREVRSATGVQGQWQRRRDDPSTFMEIYADVPADFDFDTTLEDALHVVGFSRLATKRVTEVFRCA